MPVRRATPRDAAAIADIEEVAATSPWTRSTLEEVLDEGPVVGLVALAEGAVVGHVLATAVAGEGEILTLAVRPEARRRGHARALLDALAATWRDGGVTSGWLEVRQGNHGARALYAAAGWTEAGLRPGYYSDGEDAVVLRLDLG